MNSNIIETMWQELESYQPVADANGHGRSWRAMCQERTLAARARAARKCPALGAAAVPTLSALTAVAVVIRATDKVEMRRYAQYAIDEIRKAKEAAR